MEVLIFQLKILVSPLNVKFRWKITKLVSIFTFIFSFMSSCSPKEDIPEPPGVRGS